MNVPIVTCFLFGLFAFAEVTDRAPIFHCVIYLFNVSNLEYHHLTMYLNWVTNIIHMTMFKIIAFSLTTLLTKVHLSVDILPTRGRHVHDPIISLRTETLYHRV
jgi:hypothetical protein